MTAGAILDAEQKENGMTDERNTMAVSSSKQKS